MQTSTANGLGKLQNHRIPKSTVDVPENHVYGPKLDAFTAKMGEA